MGSNKGMTQNRHGIYRKNNRCLESWLHRHEQHIIIIKIQWTSLSSLLQQQQNICTDHELAGSRDMTRANKYLRYFPLAEW